MASVPEFDYVIPEKNPIPALPDFAYQAIRGGLKGIYRGAIQGEAKAMKKFGSARWNSPYRPPFQFFSDTSMSDTIDRMPLTRVNRRYAVKLQRARRSRRSKTMRVVPTRAPYSANRFRPRFKRRVRKPYSGPKKQVSSPVDNSMQAITRRGRYPRQVLHLGRIGKFKSNVAPLVKLYDAHARFAWTQQKQAVFFLANNTRDVLRTLLLDFTETDGAGENGVLTEMIKMVYMKNQTNTPIEIDIYPWKCIRSTDTNPYKAWADGLQDWNGANAQFIPERPFMVPMMSPLFGYFYKLGKPYRVKLGGGATYTYKMKMRGNVRLNQQILLPDDADPTSPTNLCPVFIANQTFGIIVTVRGSIVDDGTTVGIGEGTLSVLENGHFVVRAVEQNLLKVATPSTLGTLTSQNVMNIESDVPTTVQTA